MRINKRKKRIGERGFSYIDVLISITIMLVGILGLVSALTANLVRSYESEKRVISKQLALSTIESIISARDVNRAGAIDGWNTIGNVGSNPVDGTPQGIFLNDWKPIREDLGWDGVAGTIDDACPGTGPCAVPGRPTNSSPILTGYQRKIVITDIPDSERPTPPYPIGIRKIEVTIRFYVNGVAREEVGETLLTNY